MADFAEDMHDLQEWCVVIVRTVVAVLIPAAIIYSVAVALGLNAHAERPDLTAADVAGTFPTVPAIVEPVVLAPATPAQRLDTIPPETVPAPTSTWELPPPQPTGINGLPFAPDGLTPCDEFRYYRQQFGLPDIFDRIAWRESRCIQDDGYGHHTSCCWGYLQLWIDLHVTDWRLTDAYAACGVFSHEDADSGTPVEKQANVCAAAALYAVSGMTPWRLP